MIKTTLKGALLCALLTSGAFAKSIKEDTPIVLTEDLNFTIPSAIKETTSIKADDLDKMKDSFKQTFYMVNANKVKDTNLVEDVFLYDLGEIKGLNVSGIRYTLKKDSNGNRYVFPDFSIFTKEGLLIGGVAVIGKQLSISDSIQTILFANSFYKALGNQKDQAVYFNATADDDLDSIIFIDPSCPHCVKHLNAIKTEIESGALKTAIVLTAILGEDSAKKSAYILSKLGEISDFKQKFEELQSLINRLNDGGVPDDYEQIIVKSIDRVKEAELQWDLLGVNGVPKTIPLKITK